MIRRLRWKFVAILMTVVTIFLTLILTTMYYTSRMGYERRCAGILQIALQESREPRPQPPCPRQEAAPDDYDPGRERPEFSEDAPLFSLPPIQDRSPILVAERNGDGTVRILINRLYQTDEESAAALADQVFAAEENSGTFQSESLRWQRTPAGPDGSVTCAVADISQEQSALRWQLIYSLIIGLLALAAFFAVFVFLSRWATAPIADAWKTKQQFVSDASHELKTPLTVILSNVSLLKQSAAISDPSDRRRIDYIYSEASRMKELTESLLVLARSDYAPGKAASSFVPLDFSFLTDSCVSTFEPVAFEMGKTISTDIKRGLTVCGDESKLKQLIDILMDNACKYSSKESCIRVSLKQEGGEAVLSVTTDGTPLSPEELKQLFHRFYRADPSRGSVPGFGLGLSIAQCICEEHKGKITAAADRAGQNTFTVRLPLCRQSGD